MITVTTKECNTFSQDYYNSVIYSLPFHQLTCSCGHRGCLTWHAYYHRTVKFADGSKLDLKVLRVRCSECGATHAILLSSIVPYSQIPLSVHLDAIEAHENSDGPLAACTENGSIDENNIKQIIRTYRRYWRQKLLSERIPRSPTRGLVTACFAFYSAQFMQIRSTFNTLYVRPT